MKQLEVVKRDAIATNNTNRALTVRNLLGAVPLPEYTFGTIARGTAA